MSEAYVQQFLDLAAADPLLAPQIQPRQGENDAEFAERLSILSVEHGVPFAAPDFLSFMKGAGFPKTVLRGDQPEGGAITD